MNKFYTLLLNTDGEQGLKDTWTVLSSHGRLTIYAPLTVTTLAKGMTVPNTCCMAVLPYTLAWASTAKYCCRGCPWTP